MLNCFGFLLFAVQEYLDTQNKFIKLYHEANELWNTHCVVKFEDQLKQMLSIERWDDMNASAVLWQGKSHDELLISVQA
jgi:hypothetical protein